MDALDLEIRNDFLAEAKELLAGTEHCFLTLEKDPKDLANLNLIFRLAHNLKGSSGAVGFMDLMEFTHKLESLLLLLKEGKLAVEATMVDLLLRSNDYLAQTIEALSQNPEAICRNDALKGELIAAASGTFAPKAQAVEEVAAEMEQHTWEPKAAPAEAPAHKSPEENIRVSLARIEQLLDNVGELTILQAVMVQQSYALGTQMPTLMRDTLSAMTKIIKDTQNLSMGLRMVPVRQTFQKMERIVRDTSKALHKTAELHLVGEETELDKIVLEQLADPLVHLIRNAVDHGLETTEGRLAAGKPELGNIYLSASHQAGQVLIEVREDGRGMDAAALIARAKSRGIIAPDAELTQEQAYQLIFAPGFSTKDVVTDVSGRGVGMDVVKTNITSLQGRIEIHTEVGKGTTFRIFLPLTLAIIDSIVIRSGESRFVVPLSQISEFYRPQESDITMVYGRDEIMNLRSETLKAHRLSRLLGINEAKNVPAWDLTSLILRFPNGRSVAVMVDQIVAQQQVVVKPVGREIKDKAGVMGFAILGDGKPSLILDLLELLDRPTKGAEMKPTLKRAEVA